MRISFFIIIILVFGVVRVDAQTKRENLLTDATADDILGVIHSYTDETPVLVNFWATWCGPCVEEFPYLMELRRKYEGQFVLIFVSCDFEEARSEAIKFLEKQGVNFTTFFKTGKDNEFIQAISAHWSGALPYTIIYDRQGNVSDSWEGKADSSTFERALNTVLTVQ